nr:MAG TPA: hypothetical protein [Caudoviricetes sp.]
MSVSFNDCNERQLSVMDSLSPFKYAEMRGINV